MANRRLSELDAAGSLTGSELFYADNGTADVRVTANQIRTFASGTSDLYFTPEQYGAVGDGVTDDTQAFKDMTEAVNTAGAGYILFGADKTYLIWSTGAVEEQDKLMYFIGVKGLTIDFNGSKLSTPAASSDWVDLSYVILGSECPNVRILRPWYEQTVHSDVDFQNGAIVIAMYGDGINNNWYIEGLRCSGGISAFATFPLEPYTTRTIGPTIIGARCVNTFYGMNFRFCGDGAFVRGWYHTGGGRPYFPYNVHSHDVEIILEDRGQIQTPILMGVYSIGGESELVNSLSNMRLKCTFPQQTTTPPDFSCLDFFVGDGGNSPTEAFIRNIDIELVIYNYISGTNELISFGGDLSETSNSIYENMTFRITSVGAGDAPIFKWDTSLMANSVIRNLTFRDCSITGSTFSPAIDIDATNIEANLVLDNVYSDENISITNAGNFVLREHNVYVDNLPGGEYWSDDGTTWNLHVGSDALPIMVASAGLLTLNGPQVLKSYAKASLPTVVTGGMIYVTDETGGAVPCFSDGVNWRRVTDRNIVS